MTSKFPKIKLEDYGVEYPQAHDLHREILLKRNEIDELYRDVNDLTERAREDYRNYNFHLFQMGQKHKQVHELMKRIVTAMKELEQLTVEPLI